jgi:hypothetical protein
MARAARVTPEPPRRGITATLVVSGLAGYYVGSRGFPEWQVPVETAQVIAGLVHYPYGNPFLIYHLQLWTVLHQVCAALLSLGASEIRLSTILSGVTGMLSFQALALTVRAFGAATWLSTLAAILIFTSRAAEYGVRYPIFLLGSSHTYGSVGLSLVVLVVALVGNGTYAAGLFLLGVAPSIHPSLGVWLALIAGLALLSNPDVLRQSVLPRWRWFAAGVLVSAASLSLHLWSARAVPAIDPASAARYLDAFTALWDEHRQPMGFANAGVALNAAAFAVGLLWLTAFRTHVPAASGFILRFAVTSAVVSIGCVAMSHLPPERLPGMLVVLMPTRVVNVNAMLFAALVFGLTCAYRQAWWARALMVALVAALLLNHQGLLSSRFHQTTVLSTEPRLLTLEVLLAAAGMLVAGAAWVEWSARRGQPRPRARRSIRVATDLAVIIITAAALGPDIARLPPRLGAGTFRDRTNDGLFATAARGSGLLLTGGDMHLVQLRTRRPVLIDGGGLDGLPYAIAGAPAVERILRDVYGMEFFHPPDEARGIGMIPSGFNQRVWEQYSAERWREIRRAYNVTEVLTYNNWMLRLPIVAQNGSYLLYEIPE